MFALIHIESCKCFRIYLLQMNRKLLLSLWSFCPGIVLHVISDIKHSRYKNVHPRFNFIKHLFHFVKLCRTNQLCINKKEIFFLTFFISISLKKENNPRNLLILYNHPYRNWVADELAVIKNTSFMSFLFDAFYIFFHCWKVFILMMFS